MSPPPGLSPGELDDPWAEASRPAPLSASPPAGAGWGAIPPGTSASAGAAEGLRSSPAVSSPLTPGGSARGKEPGGSPASPSILSPRPRARAASLLSARKYPRAASQPVSLAGLRDIDPDVSRPSLKRLTSETERQLWEDSTVSSRGGSFEREREREDDVEVIVHAVAPRDSLAGVALRYGIDTATLRKVNKLWPSDPVHVRTSLYVPLEACRPTSGLLVRSGGSVLLVPHRRPRDSSPPRQANGDAASVLSDSTARGSSPEPGPQEVLADGEDPLTAPRPPPPPSEPGAVPLQVVKLPASRLHLYPARRRRANASASGRVSLDSDASGLSGLSGLSGSGLTTLSLNDAAAPTEGLSPPRREEEGRFFGLLPSSRSDSGLASGARGDGGRFAPLMPRVDGFGPDDEPDTFGRRRTSGKRVVKLRPPAAPPPPRPGVAGRIAGFFSPAPPPLPPSAPGRRIRAPTARIVSEPATRESSRSGSPSTRLEREGLEPGVELHDAHRPRAPARRTNKKTD